ncbi:hypothetical protein PR048_010581 [Dryococelus australis]|uniref:Uncharacterized protein n=1 Tax=Dryococelus australis TaxID=614101 RepID=A0ABQ9I359_9NEOP|nr:hypothetical protein PR048_010581 [Dryococelus australis]
MLTAEQRFLELGTEATEQLSDAEAKLACVLRIATPRDGRNPHTLAIWQHRTATCRNGALANQRLITYSIADSPDNGGCFGARYRAALNSEVLRADEAASSGTIPNCENPVTRPGIEPGLPWRKASGLIAQLTSEFLISTTAGTPVILVSVFPLTTVLVQANMTYCALQRSLLAGHQSLRRLAYACLKNVCRRLFQKSRRCFVVGKLKCLSGNSCARVHIAGPYASSMVRANERDVRKRDKRQSRPRATALVDNAQANTDNISRITNDLHGLVPRNTSPKDFYQARVIGVLSSSAPACPGHLPGKLRVDKGESQKLRRERMRERESRAHLSPEAGAVFGGPHRDTPTDGGEEAFCLTREGGQPHVCGVGGATIYHPPSRPLDCLAPRCQGRRPRPRSAGAPRATFVRGTDCLVAFVHEALNRRAAFLSSTRLCRTFSGDPVILWRDNKASEESRAALNIDALRADEGEVSCVFIGCYPTPGSYGIRKAFPCKSAIGSEACRAGLINCDPIVKAVWKGGGGVGQVGVGANVGTRWLQSSGLIRDLGACAGIRPGDAVLIGTLSVMITLQLRKHRVRGWRGCSIHHRPCTISYRDVICLPEDYKGDPGTCSACFVAFTRNTLNCRGPRWCSGQQAARFLPRRTGYDSRWIRSRTMSLHDGFSRVSPVSLRPYILALLRARHVSPSSALKSSHAHQLPHRLYAQSTELARSLDVDNAPLRHFQLRPYHLMTTLSCNQWTACYLLDDIGINHSCQRGVENCTNQIRRKEDGTLVPCSVQHRSKVTFMCNLSTIVDTVIALFNLRAFIACNKTHCVRGLICTAQRRGGNTARLARRGDEALEVRYVEIQQRVKFSRDKRSPVMTGSPLKGPPQGHVERREHCTPVQSTALSGDGTLDERGSVVFISLALFGSRYFGDPRKTSRRRTRRRKETAARTPAGPLRRAINADRRSFPVVFSGRGSRLEGWGIVLWFYEDAVQRGSGTAPLPVAGKPERDETTDQPATLRACARTLPARCTCATVKHFLRTRASSTRAGQFAAWRAERPLPNTHTQPINKETLQMCSWDIDIYSPPNMANRVQCPAESLLDFCMWESWRTIHAKFLLLFGIRINFTLLSVLQVALFLHWLLRRYGATPFLTGLRDVSHALRSNDKRIAKTPQYSPYWTLSCEFIGCCPTPGSYWIRKVFPYKSAIGSEACRMDQINCDPIANSCAYWSLSCVFIGCCPTPGSYGFRKVFPYKSATGSEACRMDLINCDPIANAIAVSRCTHVAITEQASVQMRNGVGDPFDQRLSPISAMVTYLLADTPLSREPFGSFCSHQSDVKLSPRASPGQSENGLAHTKGTATPFRICANIYGTVLAGLFLQLLLHGCEATLFLTELLAACTHTYVLQANSDTAIISTASMGPRRAWKRYETRGVYATLQVGSGASQHKRFWRQGRVGARHYRLHTRCLRTHNHAVCFFELRAAAGVPCCMLAQQRGVHTACDKFLFRVQVALPNTGAATEHLPVQRLAIGYSITEPMLFAESIPGTCHAGAVPMLPYSEWPGHTRKLLVKLTATNGNRQDAVGFMKAVCGRARSELVGRGVASAITYKPPLRWRRRHACAVKMLPNELMLMTTAPRLRNPDSEEMEIINIVFFLFFWRQHSARDDHLLLPSVSLPEESGKQHEKYDYRPDNVEAIRKMTARLLSPMHTGASAACSLAVASTPGSNGIRKVFPCKSAIGSEACRAGLVNCDPIATFQDRIDIKLVYTEVTFAVGSEFIMHALEDSEPIASLQGHKTQIPYCQVWGNTGVVASEQTLEVRLYKGLIQRLNSCEFNGLQARLYSLMHKYADVNWIGCLRSQGKAMIGTPITRRCKAPCGRMAWLSAGTQGRGKREIPDNIRRPAASSGPIPTTCENQGATPSGNEPGSPRLGGVSVHHTTAAPNFRKSLHIWFIQFARTLGLGGSELRAAPVASVADDVQRPGPATCRDTSCPLADETSFLSTPTSPLHRVMVAPASSPIRDRTILVPNQDPKTIELSSFCWCICKLHFSTVVADLGSRFPTRQFRRFEMNFISTSSPALNLSGATVFHVNLRADLGAQTPRTILMARPGASYSSNTIRTFITRSLLLMPRSDRHSSRVFRRMLCHQALLLSLAHSLATLTRLFRELPPHTPAKRRRYSSAAVIWYLGELCRCRDTSHRERKRLNDGVTSGGKVCLQIRLPACHLPVVGVSQVVLPLSFSRVGGAKTVLRPARLYPTAAVREHVGAYNSQLGVRPDPKSSRDQSENGFAHIKGPATPFPVCVLVYSTGCASEHVLEFPDDIVP